MIIKNKSEFYCLCWFVEYICNVAYINRIHNIFQLFSHTLSCSLNICYMNASFNTGGRSCKTLTCLATEYK